jgi:hypothetical protein
VAAPCSQWIACSPVRKRIVVGRSTQSLGSMRTGPRNAIVSIVVLVAAMYAHFPASSWWFRTAIEGEHGPSPAWFNYGRFAFAAFEFVWGVIIGAAVAAAVRSPKPMQWAVCCGILGSLFLLATTTDHFFPDTPISTIVWAKSAYLMPILGAAIGALLLGFWRKRSKHAA